MIFYTLNVKRGNKNLAISDELANAIQSAVKDASDTPNSKRKGRYFEYIGRKDEKTVRIRLVSETPINATRAIQSITRSLLRNYEDKEELIASAYCGNILNAEIEETANEASRIMNLDDNEVIEEVFKVFYSRNKLDIVQRRRAKKAADDISQIILDYLNGKDG